MARRRGLVRNALVLLSGTGLAQLVPILALPLLTRLYSPADFGLAGVYSAVLAIVSVAASWRYEHAILLADSDREASAVLRFALRLGLATAVLVGVVALVSRELLAQVVEREHITLLVVALPIAVALVGVTQACTVALLRRETIGVISRGRVFGAAATVAVSVAGGLYGAGGVALVAGALCGQAVTTATLGFASLRGMVREDTPSARAIASKFRRFPLFTVPADLASAAAAQYPLLFLSSVFGPQLAGVFALSQRVLGMPLSVVGSAVLDAYKRDAAAEYAASGDCSRLALRAVLGLTALALPGWLLIILCAPRLFSLLFGSHWEEAGAVSQLLATPLFLRFVMTPVSYNFYLAGRQAEDLAAQAYNLGSAIVLLWVCSEWRLSADVTIAIYAANLTLVFAYYLLRSLALSRRTPAPVS